MTIFDTPDNFQKTKNTLFNRVFYGVRLKEAYYKKDSTFIDEFIDDVIYVLKIYSTDQLQLSIPHNYRRLQQLGSCYNLEFIIDHDSGATGLDTVSSGSYDPRSDDVTVEITENFLFAIKEDKDAIINLLKDFISHEYTHNQQLKHANNNIPGYTDDTRTAEYYIQPSEVDAYARQFAAELEHKGYSKDDVWKLLNSKDIDQKKFKTRIWPYTEHFRTKRPDVWKRFVREIYNYYYNDAKDEMEWMEIEKKHRDARGQQR